MSLPHLQTLLQQGNTPALLDQLLSQLPGSPVSKRNILSGWRLYMGWLEQEGKSLIHADLAQAEAYAAWLRHTYSAPATINNRLTQVRKLYRQLQAEALIQSSPFESLHGIINPAHERRPFYSPEEVQRLLAQADLETQLVVLLGAHAGLTGNEVIELRYEDCHPDCLYIGQRIGQRVVNCSPELTQVLSTWREKRGERPLLVPELEGRLFGFKDDQELRARIWQLCRRANVEYRGWYALRNAAGIRIFGQDGAKAAERQLGLGGRAALHPTARLVKGKKKAQAAGEDPGDL